MNAVDLGSARATRPDAISTQLLILEPGATERHYWGDLWSYRELFWVVAWRDLAVRYKQTAIGIVWALMRPMLTLAVFFFVFGKVAKLPTDGDTPYVLLVFAGMLPWTLFSTILSDASNSLIANASLVGKVYFPRIIIPAATIVVALVDLLVTLTLFLPIAAYLGLFPGWRVVALPALILLCVLAALGPALLLASLNVKYRDFRYVIPFLLQFGLYISPVGFSSSVIPAEWRFLYSLNPVVGLVDGFRWCLLGSPSKLYIPGFVASLVVTTVALWTGFHYFRKTEKGFADYI